MPSSSVHFTSAARLVAMEARRAGLTVPSFRTPPKRPGAMRTIRRWGGGAAVVAVVVRGRSFPEVVADMVEGVLVANEVPVAKAAVLRGRILAAVGEVVRDQAA